MKRRVSAMPPGRLRALAGIADPRWGGARALVSPNPARPFGADLSRGARGEAKRPTTLGPDGPEVYDAPGDVRREIERRGGLPPWMGEAIMTAWPVLPWTLAELERDPVLVFLLLSQADDEGGEHGS